MKLDQTVVCKIPGFETVTVTYNLMATGEDLDAFQSSMGKERADKVVAQVTGLPEGFDGPTDNKLPVAVRIWFAIRGFLAASRAYAQDPNF